MIKMSLKEYSQMMNGRVNKFLFITVNPIQHNHIKWPTIYIFLN